MSSAFSGRYIKESELGSGTYGVVYRAKDRLTGNIVAIKRMNIFCEEEGVPATTIREVCLLKELHHPNIVRLYDIMFPAPKLTFVFEYCEYDLKKYVDSRSNKQLNIETEAKLFLKQLLLGLDCLEKNSIHHRDLKPQNLLINANLQLKIADFGLARVDGIAVKKYSHEAVTLWYRAPDVILGSTNYGFVVDIWSVGCIFVEMVLGHPLFNGCSDAEQLLKIYKLLGSPTKENFPKLFEYPNTTIIYQGYKHDALKETYPCVFDKFIASTALNKIDANGIDLLKRMLTYDPVRRITAVEALRHPFLVDYEVKLRMPICVPPPSQCVTVDESSGSSTSGSDEVKYILHEALKKCGINVGDGQLTTALNPNKMVQMYAIVNTINKALTRQKQQQMGASGDRLGEHIANYSTTTATPNVVRVGDVGQSTAK